MKLRLATSAFASRFHGPLRFGRAWRGHELALRLVQLAVLVVVGAIGAKLMADGVAFLIGSVAGLVS